MNNSDPNNLLVEARAKIIWGDERSSVCDYLTTNGMSAADADAKLSDFVLERKKEIRKLGIRDVLIGLAVLGGAAVFFYAFSGSGHSGRSARPPYVHTALIAIYGAWKLLNGIPRLILPKSEPGSIPEISE